MENQQPSPQPVQPEQTIAPLPKPPFPWGIVALVIAVGALSVGITLFLVKGTSLLSLSQPKPIPTIVYNPQPTIPTAKTTILPTNTVASPVPTAISPTKALSCEVPDNTYCPVLADLKLSYSSKNYAGFLAYQDLQSVTCDPDGMFVSICEGEAKGMVKQGYGIGYNQSEGTMLLKVDYIKTVDNYINSNGPFNYRGSLVSGDKGITLFLNPNKDHVLLFPLKKTGITWRMNVLILGGTFGDASFDNLSASLLDLVQ